MCHQVFSAKYSMIEPHLTMHVPLDSRWFIVHQYCIPLAWVSLLLVQGRSYCLTASPVGCYRFGSMPMPSIALDIGDLWVSNDVWDKWTWGIWLAARQLWSLGTSYIEAIELRFQHPKQNGGDRAFWLQSCVMWMAQVGTPSYSVAWAHGLKMIA